MADQYQSTDKRSQDTRPEVPRLLLEGIYTFDTTELEAVTGGFSASTEIDITSINDLGNRNKGFDPQSLEARVWYTRKLEFGGQIEDYMRPLPYVNFNNFSTGEVAEQATYYIQNVYIVADDLWASYLILTWFVSSVTTNASFSYKIYSTVYQFDDIN